LKTVVNIKKYNKICLVCSSGGHFRQLYSLKEYWEQFPRIWVTFDSSDTKTVLGDENYYWAYSPTNRNIKNLFRNVFLALRILKKEKPDLLISTGAGVAVPFIYIAKLFGIKTIYVESLTRVEDLSLTGKLIYPIVDYIFVQWPELANKYKKAEFHGRVI